MHLMDGSRDADRGFDIALAGPEGEKIVIPVKATVDPETEKSIRAVAEALQAAQSALAEVDAHIVKSKQAVRRARAFQQT